MNSLRAIATRPYRFLQAFVLRRPVLDPVHLRIGRAALWVLAFAAAAKLVGAAKEITIAWRYGRGPEVDAYNLALTLSTWLPVTLMSVMTVVLVPALVQLKGQERKVLLGDLNGVALASGAILTAIVWLAAPWLIGTFARELSSATQDMAAGMLRQMAPLALLTVYVGVFTARLQSTHNHRYALADGIPALAIMALLFGWPTMEVAPLVAGTLLGVAVQSLWLARLARKCEAEPARLNLRPKSAQWPRVWRAALVLGFGQATMSLVTPLDQYFAASLGPGAVATLGYANRLVALGMTLGATAISRATLPVFSEGVADGDHARVRAYAMQLSGIVFVIGVIGAAILATLAPMLVSVLFERGAFTAADTAVVASALRWGAWQLPFYFGGLVFVSLLASERRYKAIGGIAAASLLCKSAGNLVLGQWLQLDGLLAASCVMYAFSATLCWVAAHSEDELKRR